MGDEHQVSLAPLRVDDPLVRARKAPDDARFACGARADVEFEKAAGLLTLESHDALYRTRLVLRRPNVLTALTVELTSKWP